MNKYIGVHFLFEYKDQRLFLRADFNFDPFFAEKWIWPKFQLFDTPVSIDLNVIEKLSEEQRSSHQGHINWP